MKVLVRTTVLPILFALMPLASLACGDGPEQLKLGTCDYTTKHFVDLLQNPVPVSNIAPYTHLQGFEFASCLTSSNRSEATEVYDALEIVIEEAKANRQGFSSREEMHAWFQNRLTEVMQESYPATAKSLIEARAERDFKYFFITVQTRSAGPGVQ